MINLTCSRCGEEFVEEIQPGTGQIVGSIDGVPLIAGDRRLWRCPTCPPVENGIYRASVWP